VNNQCLKFLKHHRTGNGLAHMSVASKKVMNWAATLANIQFIGIANGLRYVLLSQIHGFVQVISLSKIRSDRRRERATRPMGIWGWKTLRTE